VNNKEIKIVREAAKKLAEIAALPIHAETKRIWLKNNMRKPERPTAIIDQIPWHEMNVDDELTVYCEDKILANLETAIKRQLYMWKHMRCDMIIENFYLKPAAVENLKPSLQPKVVQLQYDDKNTSAPSKHYEDVLLTEADADKIIPGDFRINKERQAEIDERYHGVFDGIMELRPGGRLPTFQFWDMIVHFHGADTVLYDLVDRPEFMHYILRRMTEQSMAMIDQFEDMGILEEEPTYIHCSGAQWDWQRVKTAPGKTSAKNSWTFGMSQIFSSVSPAMHEEFEFEYLKPIFERYGNVYYGCCEPLDNKMEMIRKYPNVRKISVSPWANAEKCAEQIAGDYVVSAKPHPAFLAKTELHEDEIAGEMKRIKNICKKHNCPAEFILKDLSTVRYKPERLWKWADIAMKIMKE